MIGHPLNTKITVQIRLGLLLVTGSSAFGPAARGRCKQDKGPPLPADRLGGLISGIPAPASRWLYAGDPAFRVNEVTCRTLFNVSSQSSFSVGVCFICLVMP